MWWSTLQFKRKVHCGYCFCLDKVFELHRVKCNVTVMNTHESISITVTHLNIHTKYKLSASMNLCILAIQSLLTTHLVKLTTSLLVWVSTHSGYRQVLMHTLCPEFSWKFMICTHWFCGAIALHSHTFWYFQLFHCLFLLLLTNNGARLFLLFHSTVFFFGVVYDCFCFSFHWYFIIFRTVCCYFWYFYRI